MTRHVPWPSFRTPLSLTISSCVVDGEPRSDLLRPEDLRVQLCEMDSWETVTLGLMLTIDQEWPIDVPPPHTLIAAALLRSDGGLARIPARLNRVDDSNTWSGNLRFSSDEVGGVATLNAELAEPGASPAYRVVGEAEPWAIPIDRSERPPLQGGAPLPSSWIDFREPPDGLGLLVDYARAPLHVDLRPEVPHVYFNSSLGRLQNILQNKGAQLERRRTRDLIAGQMATLIVTTLLRSGFDEISYDIDNTVRVPTNATVVRAFVAAAKHLQVDLDTFYEQVAEARSVEADLTALWAELQLAALIMVGIGDDLESITQEVFIGD